jgi:hypothetical protein
LAGNGTVRYQHRADASAWTAPSPEDGSSRSPRAAGRRRRVMAQAGHTGEAQVTVPPIQHPVRGALGAAEPRGPGTAPIRCQRTSARRGRHPAAVSCRGQTSHPTPTRPQACPGNALQAPAADAGDAGFAQLQTRTHACCGRCGPSYLCASAYTTNDGSDRQSSFGVLTGERCRLCAIVCPLRPTCVSVLQNVQFRKA